MRIFTMLTHYKKLNIQKPLIDKIITILSFQIKLLIELGFEKLYTIFI
jgi:hypothetical protein